MDTPDGREMHLLLTRLQSLAHSTARTLAHAPLDVANTAAREADQVLDPLLTRLARVRRDRVALAVDAARRAQRCWSTDPLTATTVKLAVSRLLISSSALTLSDEAARRIIRSRHPEELVVDLGSGAVPPVVVKAEPVVGRRVTERVPGAGPSPGTVDALQRALMPSGVPVLPRVRIAAGYRPAAGGDWFDVVALPDGRVALVVGDVAGRGVGACTAMGQLRILLHERLAVTGDLAAAVRAVDAAAEWVRGAHAATVCVVALDPSTGGLEYCTAGHPAPLVVSAGGEARYLPATGAGPLGVGGGATAPALATEVLAVGDLVLLYTDGILQRPGREWAQTTVELAQVAGDAVTEGAVHDGAGASADLVCGRALDLLTRDTGHRDDIVLLAAQPTAPPPDLAMRFTAVEESLGPLHDQVRTWLAVARVDGPDADALRHAAVELATNAIQHAYVDTAAAHRDFTLTATLTDAGQVRLQVTDQGRWRAPAPSADRGLGLLITDQLVDDLRVDHDEGGTRATAVHRVSRALEVGAPSRATTPGPPALPDPVLVLDQPWAPRPRIRIDGPLDAATTPEVERGVLAAGSTGTRALTVDLTGVTHLASAGVSALHRLAALHRANDTELRLYAPIGTTAEMVLSLVALGHHAHDPDLPRPAERRGPHAGPPCA
ncbi:SpoIIE family protein phosphatase [Actinosynnema sp. NPDC050436]|uniref:SpoIIE family protein phosphatase n=1 Tax=Actinosynnema sp. NPDC050436 TaxID=3155659 RepID=UPI0033EEB92F